MKERIGNKIKTLRTEKLMTQSELAGDKITRSMLSLIEHGNSEPSLSSLAYLAERLHVSPAYLLSDASEEEMYRREAKIRDVRIAYAAKEYRICLDLCRETALPEDDELNLLSAECAIGLAIETVEAGNLHGVTEFLDSAVSYAEKTRYNASHVYAEAAVLFGYLLRFSENFYSDADDAASERGIPRTAATGNPFCAYALLLSELEDTDDVERFRAGSDAALSALRISAPLLALHIEECLLMKEKRLAEALPVMDAITDMGEKVPVPILYELFRDREVCALETGDYKGAYESAGAKHEFLSRILSE
ncbi:MAG: helix-turn-helix transcriptional regulator [Clostridia bacterium]|nr:helix-turn-helix transcriptional regulator [Clostridia bacterium]